MKERVRGLEEMRRKEKYKRSIIVKYRKCNNMNYNIKVVAVKEIYLV